MAMKRSTDQSDEQPARYGFSCVGCGMMLPIRISGDGEGGRVLVCAFCGEHYRAEVDPEADDEARASVLDRPTKRV